MDCDHVREFFRASTGRCTHIRGITMSDYYSVFSGFGVFILCYTINLIYISVFYHRGLAHKAVILHPLVQRWVLSSGNWVVGIDPLAWTCMHRLHHSHADTDKDPHSPHNAGLFMLAFAQLQSYKRVLRGLIVGDKRYTSMVADLDLPVHWLNRRGLWPVPYLLHVVLAVTLGLIVGNWMVGAGYFFGIMSHPVQGWLVNAFGHAWGYRNFNTDDHSVNNTLIAWLVFGEGYQNNHHHQPRSARFSVHWWEIDPGYALCLLLQSLGVIRIRGNLPRSFTGPRKLSSA